MRFQLETLIKSKNEAVRRYEELVTSLNQTRLDDDSNNAFGPDPGSQSLNAGLNLMALPSNHAPPAQGDTSVRSTASEPNIADKNCEMPDLSKGLTETLADCHRAAVGLSECLHAVHTEWRAVQKYNGDEIWNNYRLTNKAMRALDIVQATSLKANPSLSNAQLHALCQLEKKTQTMTTDTPSQQMLDSNDADTHYATRSLLALSDTAESPDKSSQQNASIADASDSHSPSMASFVLSPKLSPPQTRGQEADIPREGAQIPLAASSGGKEKLTETQETGYASATEGSPTIMSPPEINIDYAPPTRQPMDAVRPPGVTEDTSSSPLRHPKHRSRAKSDQEHYDPPVATSGNGDLGNRVRSSSLASDQRDYILDLANPERAPSNDNSERVQKHPATFQCHLCPKRFTRDYNLRSHLRTHTDERPFKCTVCGKAFARQHDRRRHEGLHNGGKKLVCRGNLDSGLENVRPPSAIEDTPSPPLRHPNHRARAKPDSHAGSRPQLPGIPARRGRSPSLQPQHSTGSDTLAPLDNRQPSRTPSPLRDRNGSLAVWGCGKRFATADALCRHFRSEAGQICIEPLREEEQGSRRQSLEKKDAPTQTSLEADEAKIETGLFGIGQASSASDHELPIKLTDMYPALARVLDEDTVPLSLPPRHPPKRAETRNDSSEKGTVHSTVPPALPPEPPPRRAEVKICAAYVGHYIDEGGSSRPSSAERIKTRGLPTRGHGGHGEPSTAPHRRTDDDVGFLLTTDVLSACGRAPSDELSDSQRQDVNLPQKTLSDMDPEDTEDPVDALLREWTTVRAC